jgi:hypothetical protein
MAIFVLVVVSAAVFAVVVAGVAGVAVLASVAFAAAAAVAIVVIIVIPDVLGFEVRATEMGGSELDGQVRDASRAVPHGWCHTNSTGFQRSFNPKVGELVAVTTLILNEYRQSSNSSVLVFKFEVQRQLRLPITRYCLSVELV